MAAGCGRPRQWQVTVENRGEVPCSFFVTLREDGSSQASVEDVAKGKPIPLIGGQGDTVVHTVKVVRGQDERVLKPNASLRSGKRYAIVVSENGEVETSITDD
jgi:hypothetical protein